MKAKPKAVELCAYYLKRLIPCSTREKVRYGVMKWRQAIYPRRIVLGGVSFPYLLHDYNKAWTCERTVEVPFAKYYLDQHPPDRVLEVGNVLAHYYQTTHQVVDKYEVAPGVLNEDVVGIDTARKYDLIISISTLEHVGFDETPRDPLKVLTALSRLRACLSPGGRLLVTLPFGYNSHMDALVRSRGIAFDQEFFLRRVSAMNLWREVDREAALDGKFGFPYSAANALMIGLDRNP